MNFSPNRRSEKKENKNFLKDFMGCNLDLEDRS